MLKKLYQKDGYIMIVDKKKIQDMKYNYFIIQNYKTDKKIDIKNYYQTKGYIY